MGPAFTTNPLPIALCLAGRRVVLVGGGAEAADKLPKLLAAGAQVVLVAEHVLPELAQAARAGRLRWWVRDVAPSDLRAADVVLLTEQDPALAARLRSDKRAFGYLFAAIDQPDVSDFFFVSVVTRGPVQIAISTGGRAPLLARTLRTALERALGADFSEFAERMVRLRARHRALPKPERVALLARAFAGFAMDVRLSYPEHLPENAALTPGVESSSTGSVCEP